MFKVYSYGYQKVNGRRVRVDVLRGSFATLAEARAFHMARPGNTFIQYPAGAF